MVEMLRLSSFTHWILQFRPVSGGRSQRVRRIALALLSLFVWCAPEAASADEASTPMVVTANTSADGSRVPAKFVGLSFDVSSIPRLARYEDRGNLVNLMSSLGPGVLRLSGNSVDVDAAWVADGEAKPAWAESTFSTMDLEGIGALARRTGWSVVLGIGMGHFDPDRAGRQARAAAQALGPSLVAFEIGNEPSEFTDIGVRTVDWGYPRYYAQFAEYREAVTASAPHVPIEGPDVMASLDSLHWISSFARDARPAQLSVHYYPLAGCGGSAGGDLLSAAVESKTVARIGMLREISASSGIKLRLSEANSASCGGIPGASDTFASSLWTLNFLMQGIRGGLDGINFHVLPGQCDGYSAICTPTSGHAAAGSMIPQPQYYALLMARRLAAGTMVPSAVTDRPAGVTEAAFRLDDGKLALLVVSSRSRPTTVRVPGIKPGTGASVLRLIAPSTSARSDVTLGGAAVAGDGTWAPLNEESLEADASGNVSVELLADSAMLLTIDPAPAGSSPASPESAAAADRTPATSPAQTSGGPAPTAGFRGPKPKSKVRAPKAKSKARSKPTRKASSRGGRTCKVRTVRGKRVRKCVVRKRGVSKARSAPKRSKGKTTKPKATARKR